MAKARTLDFKHDCIDNLEKVPELGYLLVAMMPGGVPKVSSNFSHISKEDWEKMRMSIVPVIADQNNKHK